ncbi:MAG: hypothetical protein J5486_08065 [Bacteroidaceae bacterium]|nr:hypothetical protein [Bacteroidaceae bacterium]
MKKTVLFLTICGAALVMSCGGNKTKGEAEDADSLALEEDTEVVEAVSPDYLMLDLKGKVKSFSISGEYWDVIGNNVEFDEDGLICQINGETPNLERNDEGQITKYSWEVVYDYPEYPETESYTYTYDEQGQVLKIEYRGAFCDYDCTFERDDEGNITKRINKSATQGNTSTRIEYSEFDEKGNWTKCKADGKTVIRQLTYWE